jgi:predicted PurR-regulated permease PerM
LDRRGGIAVKGVGARVLLFGAFVIGLVDNILRPLLVGKDTKMPDYVVLISTLGGLATFGLNGFVIGPVIAASLLPLGTFFLNPRVRMRAPEQIRGCE